MEKEKIKLDDRVPVDYLFHENVPPELQVGQHRQFLVVRHLETATIVEDVLTGRVFPCWKISWPEGDAIKLFIENIDVPERPRLKFSVLNTYSEGASYDFDIVSRKDKGFVIENIENYQSFLPFSFEKMIKDGYKINLTISKLDLDKNKLIFEKEEDNSNNIKNTISPEEVLEIDRVYTFKVVGRQVTKENFNLFLLDYKGYKTTVRAYDFQLNLSLQSVVCKVQNIIGEKAYLNQDKYVVLSSIYKKNRSYNFIIEAIETDPATQHEYYLLSDHYGFSHKVYFNTYLQEKIGSKDIGKEQSFFLKKIDEKGYLILFLNNPDRQGKFYSVYQIFDEIDLSSQVNQYFFAFESLVQQQEYKNRMFSQLFEDYYNKENLWLFSYLSFLDEFILETINHKDWDKASELTQVYIKVEEWMLEGSSFLTEFGKEKKETIITKAETQLAQAKTRLKALHLIQEGKGGAFIKEALLKIEQSGYLRTGTLEVFKTMLYLLPELIQSKDSEIAEIIILLLKEDRLNEFDIKNFIFILEKRLDSDRYELNYSLLNQSKKVFDKETLENIKSIVKVQALQIFLYSKIDARSITVLKTGLLFRYLNFLTSDIEMKKRLLHRAIEAITNSKVLPLTLPDVMDINIEGLLQKELATPGEIPNPFSANLVYCNSGAIYQHAKGWALLSNQQYYNFRSRNSLNLFKNGAVLHENIIVASTVENQLKLFDLDDIISEYSGNWNQYYTHSPVNIKNTNKWEKPEIGEIVTVAFKNYPRGNHHYLFVEIVEEGYEGEGILHITEVSKIFLNGLEGVIGRGDVFPAKVVEVSQKGLSFSLIDQVWSVMISNPPAETVYAKVLQINKSSVFLMTRKGYFGINRINEDRQKFEIGQVYKFRREIRENSEHKYFPLEYLEESKIKFDEKQVFRKFLSKYIIETEHTVQEEEEENSKDERNRRLIYELVLSVENLSRLEERPKKRLELLYVAKLLTSIIKNHKSYYFDAYINFLNVVNSFAENGVKEKFEISNFVEEQTLESFGSLQLINKYYEVLQCFNAKGSIAQLMALYEGEDNPEVRKLIKLVAAHNLLSEETPKDLQTLSRTKKSIYRHISNEKNNNVNQLLEPIEGTEKPNDKMNPVVTHLGTEGKFKEFKTSFIHSAGSGNIDGGKQPFVIMKVIAGFLNASGGSLFLGVDDNGKIQGLQSEYLHYKNADKYQREIRKHIVRKFNKDVNGQIEFNFQKVDNKEFLEIIVPEYEKPVSLENKYYQRQGNETRIMEGDDLYLFFERKLKKLPLPINKNKIGKSKNLQVRGKSQNEKEIFIEGQSALLNNYNPALDEHKVLLYLYFFDNGSYLISEGPIHTNYSFELPIYEKDQNGFLLMGYDNACINKFKIENLLKKKYGRIYKNGLYNKATIVLLQILEKEGLVQINTVLNDIEYIKVVETKNITSHNLINLKGNCMVQENFDELRYYNVLNSSLQPQLKRIIYSSKQLLGKKRDHPSFEKEFSLLT